MGNIFGIYCAWFMVYSFIGWVYESILCSFMEKKVINRGFLNGPYCPIYGFGALLDIILLSRFENAIVIFFLGILLNCSVEYLTSFFMEKLFHARWWDYSDMKFNIGGRVCLAGAIVFGTFSVVLVKVIHPIISSYIYMIPQLVLGIIVIVFLVVYAVDNIITFLAVAKLDEKLEELKEILEEKKGEVIKTVTSYKDEAFERIKSHVPDKLSYKNFAEKLNIQHRRIIVAFPRLKSIKYNEVLAEFRDAIKDRKNKEKE